MSVIYLFWHLNISDTSRYLLIIGIMVCILGSCFINGRKKKHYNKIKRKKKVEKIR